MKILVLGDSDMSGRFSDGVTWPALLGESLEAAGYSDVAMTMTPFSAATASAKGYAERKIAESSPDLVLLVLGSFPFTAKFVWLRIERLLGKRAGRWYKAIEDSFDDSTRQRSAGRGSINRAAHWLVPKVVGAAPFCSREELTKNYRDIFRSLARAEDARIIIMSYPGLGAHARKGNAPAERAVFFAELQEAAREHHFTWLDGVEVFAGAAGTLKTDQLHFNADGHRLMAAAIHNAVTETLPVSAAS